MSFICILSDCAQPLHNEHIEYVDQKEVSTDKHEQNTDREDSCLINIKPEIDHNCSNEIIRYTKTSIMETDTNPSNISQTLERDLATRNVRTFSRKKPHVYLLKNYLSDVS